MSISHNDETNPEDSPSDLSASLSIHSDSAVDHSTQPWADVPLSPTVQEPPLDVAREQHAVENSSQDTLTETLLEGLDSVSLKEDSNGSSESSQKKNTAKSSSSTSSEHEPNVDAKKQDESQKSAETLGFGHLGLDGRLIAALEDLGYTSPTPIQEQVIPATAGNHRDIIGQAQTGTGKTAAFSLPILQKLIDTEDFSGHLKAGRHPRALVMAPTRELALQVAEALQQFSSYMPGFKVVPVYGGSAYPPQLRALKEGADVVVGTPGRLMDLMDKKALQLDDINFVVLDEADEMLQMGFEEDVETILAKTPSDKQVMLFSATMPKAISRIAQKYLDNPQNVAVKSKVSTGENIIQKYVQVNGNQKIPALERILEVFDHDGVIIFARTKKDTEEIADKLQHDGFSAKAINGDMPQQAREKVVDGLKKGRVDVVVATDVAARGLDVERISHVINYDAPTDAESYTHRIGRTGRAGRSGTAILFLTSRQQRVLKNIESRTKQPLTKMNVPSSEEVEQSRKKKFFDRINTTSDRLVKSENIPERTQKVQKLLDQYQEDSGLTEQELNVVLMSMLAGKNIFVDPSQGDLSANFERNSGREKKKLGQENTGRSERKKRQAGRNFTPYKISVGRRKSANPRNLTMALVKDAGLGFDDIGDIDIRQAFSLVELPSDLSSDKKQRLTNIRVGRNDTAAYPDSGGRGGRSQRNFTSSPQRQKSFSKPKHKKTQNKPRSGSQESQGSEHYSYGFEWLNAQGAPNSSGKKQNKMAPMQNSKKGKKKKG